MSRAVLYSRPGCHLCDVMADGLAPFLAERGLALETVDIDADLELKKRFGLRIPVFEMDGEIICEGRFDEDAVREAFESR